MNSTFSGHQSQSCPLKPNDQDNNAASASTKRDHLCPKVHSLASDIYLEFEKLVSIHGNDFLRNLMPLVVSALENLDILYTEKQELLMNLALTQEDQKHLLSEYEREKSSRKQTETKIFKLEDLFEEERKVSSSQISQLESTLKTSEVKIKNMSEILSRSEEREQELLKENDHVRSRYNDLLRHFTIYVERTRHGIPIDGNNPPSMTSTPFCPSERPHQLNINLYLKNGKQPENRRPDSQSIDHERQRMAQPYAELVPDLQTSFSTYGNQFVDSAFDELTQDDFHSENGHDIKSVDSSYCTPHQTVDDTSSLDMFTGVKKEVDNLIKENQDLVQTKNALNVVTSDLIGRIDDLTCENAKLTSERTALLSHTSSMLSRIKDLEQECHRLRQELENEDMCDSICSNSVQDDQSRDEDDASPEPFSTRRHFSRIEMARVLSERNYYKEQLLDLQDTVRWTETLRAQKQADSQYTPRGRSTLWTWFSKLFTPKSRPRQGTRTQRSAICSPPMGSVAVEAVEALTLEDPSSSRLSEESHSNLSTSFHVSLEESEKSVDEQLTSDWVRLLNPSYTAARSEPIRYKCHFHPLADRLTGFKLWCAVDTYPESTVSHESTGSTLIRNHHDHLRRPLADSNPDGIHSASRPCLVWVCSVATGLGESTGVVPLYSDQDSVSVEGHTAFSLISIYNMDDPIQVVESFAVTSSTVLCMAFVPGTTSETQIHLSHSESYWNNIPLETVSDELDTSDATRDESTTTTSGLMESLCWSTQSYPWSGRRPVKFSTTTQSCEWHPEGIGGGGIGQYVVERRLITSARSNAPTSNRLLSPFSEPPVSDCAVALNTTAQPTVWLGCFNGDLYIHSAVSDWRTCLYAVHLPDAITQIRHFRGRTFVSLANGQMVVFRRHTQTPDDQVSFSSVESSLPGCWNLSEVCMISCPYSSCTIQPSIVVPAVDCIWSACRNQIRVIDAISLKLINSFEVQSNNDASVRHMCCADKGVWIALRRLSMLQLYHVITHQHLQTVDLEPLVIGRLVDLKVTDKSRHPIRPSSIAVTCLAINRGQLWIGTNLGLVIRFPFASHEKQSSEEEQSITPMSLCAEMSADAPIADLSDIQVSRHQHSGAVRFILALDEPPTSISSSGCGIQLDSTKSACKELVISGGRGYAYRGVISSSSRFTTSTSGHLIVWQP